MISVQGEKGDGDRKDTLSLGRQDSFLLVFQGFILFGSPNWKRLTKPWWSKNNLKNKRLLSYGAQGLAPSHTLKDLFLPVILSQKGRLKSFNTDR